METFLRAAVGGVVSLLGASSVLAAPCNDAVCSLSHFSVSHIAASGIAGLMLVAVVAGARFYRRVRSNTGVERSSRSERDALGSIFRLEGTTPAQALGRTCRAASRWEMTK